MKVLSPLLYRAYAKDSRSLRDLCLRVLKKIDGGELTSLTLRRIFRDYHKVDIGLYTHGHCFVPFAYDEKTIIGRYCSVAHGSVALNANHPIHYKSSHGYFFNPQLGVCSKRAVENTQLSIGNDVWIGRNAIILPFVENIGNGAVIGAGSVVNKNVPPYAIVLGNPARIVKYRFKDKVIQKLLQEKWWENSIGNLRNQLREFQNFDQDNPDNL
jgi:virginiamycin A acetyltransferase